MVYFFRSFLWQYWGVFGAAGWCWGGRRTRAELAKWLSFGVWFSVASFGGVFDIRWLSLVSDVFTFCNLSLNVSMSFSLFGILHSIYP